MMFLSVFHLISISSNDRGQSITAERMQRAT